MALSLFILAVSLGLNTIVSATTGFRVSNSSAWVSSINCNEPTALSFPFIGVDAFRDLAHVSFDGHTVVSAVDGIVIYLAPEQIKNFGAIVHEINAAFTLISISNFDDLIPFLNSEEEHDKRDSYSRILESRQLTAWFAANLVMAHPKLVPIPLGNKWQWQIPQFHAEDIRKSAVLSILIKNAIDAGANFAQVERPELLLVSLSETSSDGATYAPWKGIRRRILTAIAHHFLDLQPTFSRVNGTACDGKGMDAKVMRFETYIQTLRQYKFVLSPPGRGPDCHRTWEALLMGAIPIVQSGPFDSLYQGLPVLIIRNEAEWASLTPKMLDAIYVKMHDQKYNFQKLYLPYWIQKIIYGARNV